MSASNEVLGYEVGVRLAFCANETYPTAAPVTSGTLTFLYVNASLSLGVITASIVVCQRER